MKTLLLQLLQSQIDRTLVYLLHSGDTGSLERRGTVVVSLSLCEDLIFGLVDRESEGDHAVDAGCEAGENGSQ